MRATVQARQRARSPAKLQVALVVNRNAGGVNDTLLRRLRRVMQDETLFVTDHPDEVSDVARWIVRSRFDVVLCGGGDGTFTLCVNQILGHADACPPAFGLLRLGTGNAVADTLRATAPTAQGLACALRRARCITRQQELGMLRIDGRLAPFAGLGVDAQILEDFNRTTARLGRIARGLPGYVIALASRSVWRMFLCRRTRYTVRNAGLPASRIDLDGRPVGEPVPTGALLYRGPAVLAAVSTIPQYGFGFRLFPQASRLSGRFQLRVINSSVLGTLLRLPAFCRGTLADPHIHDFACTAIEIEAERPTAFQVGGDQAGRRTRVAVGLDRVRIVQP